MFHRIRVVVWCVILTLFVVAVMSVSEQTPILCDGVQVGTLQFQENNGGTDAPFMPGRFVATFDANGMPSLSEAAVRCGEHHFNWYQGVRSDTDPLVVDRSGMQLTTPSLDTPPGGYGERLAMGRPTSLVLGRRAAASGGDSGV